MRLIWKHLESQSFYVIFQWMHVVHTHIHLNKYNFKRNYMYIYLTVFPCKHNCHAWFTSQMLVFCIHWIHRIYFFTTVINVLPLLWNSVPSDICHVHSSHAFNTTLNLKTQLYKHYHNWFESCLLLFSVHFIFCVMVVDLLKCCLFQPVWRRRRN